VHVLVRVSAKHLECSLCEKYIIRFFIYFLNGISDPSLASMSLYHKHVNLVT